MDLEDLEKNNPKTKIIALCSPHNPVGRFRVKKNLKISKYLYKHNITIVSDEIHSDITFKNSIASISKRMDRNGLTRTDLEKGME